MSTPEESADQQAKPAGAKPNGQRIGGDPVDDRRAFRVFLSKTTDAELESLAGELSDGTRTELLGPLDPGDARFLLKLSGHELDRRACIRGVRTTSPTHGDGWVRMVTELSDIDLLRTLALLEEDFKGLLPSGSDIMFRDLNLWGGTQESRRAEERQWQKRINGMRTQIDFVKNELCYRKATGTWAPVPKVPRPNDSPGVPFAEPPSDERGDPYQLLRELLGEGRRLWSPELVKALIDKLGCARRTAYAVIERARRDRIIMICLQRTPSCKGGRPVRCYELLPPRC
jgi:hypothetical protein